MSVPKRQLVLIGVFWTAVVSACNVGQNNSNVVETREVVQEFESTIVQPTSIERSFQQYSSQNAIDAFKAAGLEVQNPIALVPDDHSPLPPTFVEAQRFQMPALDGRTGRIFSFESENDLQAVQEYYEQFTGAQANLVIVKDNLLLQISAETPADLANAYRDALKTLK